MKNKIEPVSKAANNQESRPTLIPTSKEIVENYIKLLSHILDEDSDAEWLEEKRSMLDARNNLGASIPFNGIV
jgi:hypothetical protein